MKSTLKRLAIAAGLLALPSTILAQPPNAPFAGAAKMTCAQALKQVSKDDASLTPLAKSFDSAAAKLKKSPKDAKAKKSYVDSAMKYEHEIYLGKAKLSPAIKYRAALQLCRLVLAVDSKNDQAKKDEDQMVAIYKQMGRPVPE